jgi:hypothetical protein
MRNGGQTMVLADHTSGHITGIDLFAGFIDIFNAQTAGKEYPGQSEGHLSALWTTLPFRRRNWIWSGRKGPSTTSGMSEA